MIKSAVAQIYRVLLMTTLLLIASLTVGSARAEHYPSRTIKIIVPYSAGTGIDIAARLLAGKMQQQLKQSVIVENRVGAAGNIGTASVAMAKPDGYTLLLVANTLAMNPSLYHLPYNPVTSFTPIGLFLKGAMVLAIGPNIKANTIAELVALAKKSPGKLNYSSAGIGTPGQLAMEFLKSATGIDVTQISYKDAHGALLGLIRGETDMMFIPVQSALPNLGHGRIRALGISSPISLPRVSNLKTIAAQINDPEFNVDLWYGLFAPEGTPKKIVTVLNNEIKTITAMPDVRDRLRSMALIPSPSSPDELAQLLKKDMSRWSIVIRQAGITRK